MRWADYVEDVVSKLGLRHLMEQITAYLHETGRVLWFAEHPQLRDYIVLRPNWFADLLKAIFRHDMATLDFGQDETLKLHVSNTIISLWDKVDDYKYILRCMYFYPQIMPSYSCYYSLRAAYE